MSVLILKARPAVARALSLPAADTSVVTRAAGLAVAAIVASSVFSAGWAAAELMLKAI